MVTNIKAIETSYAGYLFRSRLEARWAVFFDHLGIEFDYEAEGYECQGIRYLPDFWIPSIDSFVEIKPTQPDTLSKIKADALATETGKYATIFFGPIPYPHPSHTSESAILFFPGEGQDFPHSWGECGHCGRVGIGYCGNSDRVGCGCSDRTDSCGDTVKLVKAYAIARSYRFE